jgi:hypothetical protein
MEVKLDEPLDTVRAKELILEILGKGTFVLRPHCLKRMEERRMDSMDVVNVLRAGVVTAPSNVNGSWRYRVCTQRMTAVVAFRSPTSLVVITAWRNDCP